MSHRTAPDTVSTTEARVWSSIHQARLKTVAIVVRGAASQERSRLLIEQSWERLTPSLP